MSTAPTQVFHELRDLLRHHDVEPRGVIHVGAHEGQEIGIYDGLFDHVMLVEPNPKYAARLRENLQDKPGYEVVEAAISDTIASRGTLHLTSFDQQSSLHKPMYARPVGSVDVDVVPLRGIQSNAFNVLVIDCQGSERDVLCSGDLDLFDMIVVEVSVVRRYHGGAEADDVRGELAAQGWRFVEHFPHDGDRTVVDLVYTPERRQQRGGGRALYYDRGADVLHVEAVPHDEIEELGDAGSDLKVLIDAPSGVTVGFRVDRASEKYSAEVLSALPSS